jgi:hypothetical protein
LHFFFAAAVAPVEAEPDAELDPAFGQATATELKSIAVQAAEAKSRESMARL